MKHRVARLPLLLLLGIMFAGCDSPTPVASGPPTPPPPPGSAPPPPPAAAPSVPSGQAPLPPETKFGVFAGDVNDLAARPTAPAPQQPQPEPAADANTERVKAEKGVGLKGRSLDQYEGLIVTPAKAFFSTKERIAFEIEVPHAPTL